MKIFRPKSKPKLGEFIGYLNALIIGFACRLVSLPEDNALLRSAILFGRGMLPVSVGAMIGLAIRRSRYNSLSPEEQRDEDRQNRDERNLMIRDRAAWVAYNVIVMTWVVIGTVFYIMDRLGIALLCIGMSIFATIVWSIAVVWIRRKPL